MLRLLPTIPHPRRSLAFSDGSGFLAPSIKTVYHFVRRELAPSQKWHRADPAHSLSGADRVDDSYARESAHGEMDGFRGHAESHTNVYENALGVYTPECEWGVVTASTLIFIRTHGVSLPPLFRLPPLSARPVYSMIFKIFRLPFRFALVPNMPLAP
jgi:hypothetical protein